MARFQTKIDPARLKGRGVDSNQAGRFERYVTADVDDGWVGDGEALPPLRTEVREERPRRVITRNTSPDLSFDRSLNPYRGCEHGCIYCFARPSHAWLGLSPGLDFETKLIARPDAPAQLARELAAPRYRPAPLALGTNTDPYQPIEGERQIMRGVLEVLWAHRHPVAIVTKGTLIERDLDLLAPMAAAGLARVGFSVTTLNPDLSRAMEPRVPAPKRRLRTIERLAAAGVPTRIFVSPIIPALTDPEMEQILTEGADRGAQSATWSILRLPREVSPLFQDWIENYAPDRAKRVMARVREAHGGQDYDPNWGKRLRGEGEYARLIGQRFKLTCRRLGLDQTLPDLRRDLFRVPSRRGDQLSLF